MFSEKETLEKVYSSLLEEHRALQTSHDDALAEKQEVQAQLRQLQKELDGRRNEKADGQGMMRVEMERLRGDLWVHPFLFHVWTVASMVGTGRKVKKIFRWRRRSWTSKRVC